MTPHEPSKNSPESKEENQKPVGIINIIGSVLAAAFGIQSQKNRERDFKRGGPADYIVMGIVFVVLLVVGMIVFVQSVLPN